MKDKIVKKIILAIKYIPIKKRKQENKDEELSST